MNPTFEPLEPAPPAGKPLWAAVGVFVVAVLALGAAVVHIQAQPEEPHAAVLAFTLATANTPAADLAEKTVDKSNPSTESAPRSGRGDR